MRPGGAEIWFCVAAAGAGAVGPGSPCSPVRRFHTEAVQFPDGDGALTTPWGVVEAGPGSSAQERLASLLTGAGTGVGSSLCPALLPRCPGASLLPQATSPSGLLTAPWKAAAGPHLRFPALSGREADLSSPPRLCPDSVGCAQAATGGSSSEIQAPERATPFYTCQRPCPGQRTAFGRPRLFTVWSGRWLWMELRARGVLGTVWLAQLCPDPWLALGLGAGRLLLLTDAP